jgi:hypothetical protein
MQGGGCKERVGCGRTVPGALAVTASAAICLGAVAYAAGAREADAPDKGRKAGIPLRPRPTITQHPDRVTISPNARFGFAAVQRGVRFQCRLDRRRWRSCEPPVAFAGLATGGHSFSVRALDGRGRRSAATRFRWRLLEPKDFSIAPQLAGLSQLYPGAPPVALPVLISNPHPVPIFVTGLRAAATGDPPGCGSAENLAFAPSSVSNATPLRVPARGSASLPAPGVSSPSIQLRDLPVNQDACQNARIPLAFSGKARG